jgi:ParB family chromosome partitioning protein
MARKALGRGLDALFGTTAEEKSATEVSIDEIRAGRFQPRRGISEEKLDELAQSIREHGVVQPILVRRVAGGYEIVAGERRWRAAVKVGLSTIPAVVRELSDSQTMEIGLVENLQREDLNPVEEAEAYRRLLDDFGLTQDEVARRIGKSRAQVANTVRLLNLPQAVQEHILTGAIQMGHAKVLLGLESAEAIIIAGQRIAAETLSVRETERLVRGLGKSTAAKVPPARPADPALADVEETLRAWLGTSVRVHFHGAKGKIEIEFYGTEDLQRVLDLLTGSKPLEDVRKTTAATDDRRL